MLYCDLLQVNFEQHILAKYLMELSIVDYDMVHLPSSKIAAAASWLSLKLKGHKWVSYTCQTTS